MQMTTCIILLNYKTWHETIACLESLTALENRGFYVAIGDICDLENSRDHLHQWLDSHPDFPARLLGIDHNPGFAGANNFVIEKCLETGQPDFFWLLNNDTVVDSNALGAMMNAWQQLNDNENNPGFLGSMVMRYDQPDMVEHAGDRLTPQSELRKLFTFGKKLIPSPEESLGKVDYVIGASMFFHRELINRIGLMNEDYFLYYEDIDWCYTALQNDFTNYTCTQSVVYHKQGSTTGNKYFQKTYNPATSRYVYSSYLRFFRKFYPKFSFVAKLMLFRKVAGSIMQGRLSEANIIARVLFSKRNSL
jgi:GT2 family glycosyltransferase